MGNIAIFCENCGKNYKIDQGSTGVEIQCVSCKHYFQVKNAAFYQNVLKDIDESNIESLPEIGAPKDSQTPETQKKFGDFELIESIALNKYVEVWKAKRDDGDPQVLRILIDDEFDSEEEFQSFKRKINVLSGIKHMGIGRMIEVGKENNTLYVSSEYSEGVHLSQLLDYQVAQGESKEQDLHQVISKLHSGGDFESVSGNDESIHFPIAQAFKVISMIGEAMEYVHERGIQHQFLSPGQILMQRDGAPVVLNIGLSKVKLKVKDKFLETNEAFYEMEYLAPEQFNVGEIGDARADVYSLAAILYKMLTGRVPRAPENILVDGKFNLKKDALEAPSSIVPTLGEGIDKILLKALSFSPEDRYHSISNFVHALHQYIHGDQVIEQVRKEMNVAKYLLIFIAFCILFVSGGYVFVKHKKKKRIAEVEIARYEAALKSKVMVDLNTLRQERKNLDPKESFRSQKTLDRIASLLKGKKIKERLVQKNPSLPIDELNYTYEFYGIHMDLSQSKTLVDISPIREIPLTNLNIDDTKIKDLNPIKGQALYQLSLSKTSVSDLSALKGMPLKRLNVDYTKVKDIEVLRGLPLVYLSLKNTSVKDLSPLKGSDIKYLNIRGTGIKDVRALHESPIEEIFLDINEVEKGLNKLINLPSLKRVNGKSI